MDKTLKIALILTAMDKMSGVIENAVTKSNKKLTGMQKVQAGMNKAGNASLVAGGAISAFMLESISAAEESEIATNKLANTFAKMGDKTGKAAKAAADYASTLQYAIGVEDEQIMAVQTKLATFKKASDETARQSGMFNRIVKAAFDMEAIGFGDAMSNITAFGKAFNDPLKGATAMKKAGTLTAKEVGHIQLIAQTKGIVAAQGLIIKALERQGGGAAEKNATAAKKAKLAFGELQEKIGSGLVPIINKYIDKVISLLIKAGAWVEQNQKTIETIAKVGVALIGIGMVLKITAPLIWVLTSLWGLSGKALLLFGRTVSTVNKIMMTTGIMLIITAIAVAAYLLIKNWDSVKKFFASLWNTVKAIFINTWNWIKNLFLSYTPGGLIIKHWNKITTFFSGLWTKVKNIFMGYVNWVLGLGGKFFNAGANIVKSIWNGIKSLINKPIEAIKGMVTKIRNFLPFSPAKEGPLRDIHRIKLVETIVSSIKVKPAVDAMRRVTTAMANGGGGINATPALAPSSGGSITLHYAPVIHGGGGNVIDELKKHDRELLRMIDEAMRKRERTRF